MFYSRHLGRFIRARWTRALAVALTAGLLNSLPTHAAGGHWTVLAVDGTVTVIGSSGETYAASKGQPVIAGSKVVTERDSAVILSRRGDSITVYPDTELTIPATSGAGEPSVVQSIGRLLFRMETRESRNFEVETPFLAATVKGTTFTVVVTRTNATVSVAEGSVRVAAARSGRSEMVRPGWRATVAVDRDFVDVAMRQRRQNSNVPETVDSLANGGLSGKSASQGPQDGDNLGGGASGGGSGGGGSKGGGAKGGGAKDDVSKGDGSKSDGSKSDGSKSDGSKSDGSKSDGSKSDGSKSDGSKSDGSKRGGS